MRRLAVTPALALAALLLAGPAESQEEHAVTGAELEALVLERTEAAEADRTALRELLRHPRVRAVAEAVGLDVRRAEAAVEVLEPAEVERLAPRARELDRALAGGASTIVISTTTLIIALLVLILILVID